jgi:hypothetical protein
LLGSLPLMPEWGLVVLGLAALSALGTLWRPMLAALPLLILAIGAPLIQAGWSAVQANFTSAPRSRAGRWRLRALTAFLHLLQPAARLWGRLAHGLSPWRRRAGPGLALPVECSRAIWSEAWQSPEAWLGAVEAALKTDGVAVVKGGSFDAWDLEVRCGLLGAARTLMTVEEHGDGKQLIRFRVSPRAKARSLIVAALLAGLASGAALDAAGGAAVILALAGLLTIVRTLDECSAAMASVLRALPTRVGTVVRDAYTAARQPIGHPVA